MNAFMNVSVEEIFTPEKELEEQAPEKIMNASYVRGRRSFGDLLREGKVALKGRRYEGFTEIESYECLVPVELITLRVELVNDEKVKTEESEFYGCGDIIEFEVPVG